jgi:hypothetical protein
MMRKRKSFKNQAKEVYFNSLFLLPLLFHAEDGQEH